MQMEVEQTEVMQMEMTQTKMKLTVTLKNPRSTERLRLRYWQRARPASFADPAGSYSARFDSTDTCTS